MYIYILFSTQTRKKQKKHSTLLKNLHKKYTTKHDDMCKGLKTESGQRLKYDTIVQRTQKYDTRKQNAHRWIKGKVNYILLQNLTILELDFNIYI